MGPGIYLQDISGSGTGFKRLPDYCGFLLVLGPFCKKILKKFTGFGLDLAPKGVWGQKKGWDGVKIVKIGGLSANDLVYNWVLDLWPSWPLVCFIVF